MPGKVAKIGTFSDWIGLFNDWRKDIGVNTKDIDAFHFDTLYGAIDTEEIEFGSYKGRRKWENLRQIPTQQMRDALMNMIVYQCDTEFASVEQQRNLLENAPTEWDRRAITRVMIEEMRHGWQMCALLVDHFGYSGKVEAQKMLERRRQLDGLLYLHRLRRSRWEVPVADAEVFRIRSPGAIDVVHAARRSLPHGHRQRRTAAHRGSRRDSGVADSEISQQVDFKLLRLVRD